MSIARLFVYGTLKRGLPLHDRALSDARFEGGYRTIERYPMLIAGPWYVPMMLDEPGRGCQVRGELYAVDECRLAVIDALEQIGKPGNLRLTIEVVPLGGGARISALAYLKSAFLAAPAHTSLL